VASYKSPTRDKQRFLFDAVFQPLADVVEQGASNLAFQLAAGPSLILGQ
jgi:hypothetical protein